MFKLNRLLVWCMLCCCGKLSAQTFTGLILPRYMKSLDEGTDETGSPYTLANAVPYVYRAKITGLTPNATYRYINGVMAVGSSTISASGHKIYVPESGSWKRSTGTSTLSNAANYSEFKTDANGEYTGWFITEPRSITPFYTGTELSPNEVKMVLLLNNGDGTSSIKWRLAMDGDDVNVQVRKCGTEPYDLTAIRSTAATDGVARNFVFLYDNENATGRPVSGAYIENEGIDASALDYAGFYKTAVDNKDKCWGTVIPNGQANGIRKIVQYGWPDGQEKGSNTSADGSWAAAGGGTVSTVNPAGGADHVIELDGAIVTLGSSVIKQNQTISFNPLQDKTVGDADFDPGATASSGLPVSYASSNTAVATLTPEGKIHITGAGTTTITASQAGNNQYNAAPAVTQVLKVNAANPTEPQTIRFPALTPRNAGDADFDPGATASSGLAVSYSSSNTAVATITPEGKVHIVGPGSTEITATQTGNAVYKPADPVTQTLVVNPAKQNQTISFPPLAPVETGAEDIDPGATASSGLPVSYSSSNTAVATIDNGKIHVLSPGSTVITATQAGNEVYHAAAPVEQTLVVNAAGQVISFEGFAAPVSYGTAAFVLSATSTNPAVPIVFTSNNTQVAVVYQDVNSQWWLQVKGAGAATITASQAGDETHAPAADVARGLTVNKAIVTIKADDKSKLTGEDNPPLTYTTSGWMYTDDAALITTPVNLTTTATKNSPAGTYDIVIEENISLQNYDVQYVNGKLTIGSIAFSPIPVKTYGDAPFTVTATSMGGAQPVYSIDNPAVATVSQNGTITIHGAGTALVKASFPANGNQPAQEASQVLTVNKKELKVTVDAVSRPYGEENPTFTVRYTGFVLNEDESILTSAVTALSEANAASPAGVYAIRLSGGAAANYSFAYQDGSLQVTRVVLTVTADTLSKMYGPQPVPAFTLRYSGFVHNETLAVLSTQPRATTVATAGSPAGTYAIKISGGSAVNYIFNYTDGLLTIEKAPLTITADNQVRDRGAANPAFTVSYNGFVNGDNASVLTTPVSVTTTATETSAAGNYAIEPGSATALNYTIRFVSGTLTVRNNQLASIAPFSVMTYGDQPFEPGAVSDAGILPVYTTDNPAVAVIENNRVRITGAGTATITATFPAGNGYLPATISRVLTVQKKALVIAAANAGKQQGDPNPVFTAVYNGFVNGDTYTSLQVQPQFSTTAVTASPAGNYPITVSGASAVNYAISYVPGNLSVELPVLPNVIVFNPLAAASYGDPDIDPGATASSGLPVTYTSSNTAIAAVVNGKIHLAGVGTVTITASQAGDATHVAAQDVTQQLEVRKAVVTIIANDQTRKQDEPNPPLTLRYTGFVNGDDSTVLLTQPVATTTALTNAVPGTYDITVSGGSAEKYQIRYQRGSLFVLPPAGSSEDNLYAYCSSPGMLQVNLYTLNEGKSSIQLFDLGGKRLVNTEVNISKGFSTYTIPVGSLASGMYIIRVAGGKLLLKSKVLIR